MLLRGQLAWPRDNVGRVIRFADGSSAVVYRETVVVGRAPAEPCFLVVAFRLRWVQGPRGHALFRLESILNTPLFVGFPGFSSKLWLRHDERGVYRGLYTWDGSDRAERYARCLWRVLELVCEPGSIHYRVFAAISRDDAMAEPGLLVTSAHREDEPWARVVAGA
jgi:hypothetical protein